MPPRSSPADLFFTGRFICKSCLSSLRIKSAEPHLTRFASSSRQLPKKRSAPRQTRLQAQASFQSPKPSQRVLPTFLDQETPAQPRSKPKPQELDDGSVVRYFQEGPNGKREEIDSEDLDEDPDQLDRDLESLEASLEAKVKELQSKLETVEGFQDLLRNHGLEAAAERLGQDSSLSRDLVMIGREGQDGPLEITVPQIDVRGRQRQDWTKKINDLNKWLRRAVRVLQGDAVTSKDTAYIWKTYSMARSVLAKDWNVVPQTAWRVLWGIFSWEDNRNPNRMNHTAVLASDMIKAGIELNDGQQLLHIEAVFICGEEKRAIEMWRKANTTLGTRYATETPYWELGVRMLSLNGDLERAKRAIETLFDRSPEANPRVMLPYIRACALVSSEDAFPAYGRMRQRFGSSMKIEDYDEITSCFLATGETRKALTAFVDMMFSGTIDLRGHTRLPLQISNSFFMGKWLKRLIGAGDLDGAYNVLLHMQQMGVMAAAIQVNGLLGAWLRNEVAADTRKADVLAWAMIDSRRSFVELRRREASLEWPIRLQASATKSKTELTYVPKATLETFCLMAENYRSRNMHQRLAELWVAFKECEISGDSFMMNQLIESHVQQGQGGEARDLYHLMVNENQLLPDAYTFGILFKSLPCHQDPLINLTDEQQEASKSLCRQIFHDLIQAAYVYEQEEDGMTESQAKTILHSFRKCNDTIGLLVALQALKEVIGFQMTQPVLVELIAETDEDLSKKTQRMRRRLVSTMAYMSKAFAELEEGRGGVAGEGDEGEVAEEEQSERSYAIAQMYYREKIRVSDEELGEAYRLAAGEMGLE